MPTWNAFAAFSDEYVKKLVHGCMECCYSTYSSSLCTRTLAARVRRELQGSADAHINFRLEMLACINRFNNNHMVDHYLLFEFPWILDACMHAAKFINVKNLCLS